MASVQPDDSSRPCESKAYHTSGFWILAWQCRIFLGSLRSPRVYDVKGFLKHVQCSCCIRTLKAVEKPLDAGWKRATWSLAQYVESAESQTRPSNNECFWRSVLTHRTACPCQVERESRQITDRNPQGRSCGLLCCCRHPQSHGPQRAHQKTP